MKDASRRSTRTTRPMLASNERGADLVVTIRLGADGKVYFHDIPPAMVPVALALAPADASLEARAAALAALNITAGNPGSEPCQRRAT